MSNTWEDENKLGNGNKWNSCERRSRRRRYRNTRVKTSFIKRKRKHRITYNRFSLSLSLSLSATITELCRWEIRLKTWRARSFVHFLDSSLISSACNWLVSSWLTINDGRHAFVSSSSCWQSQQSFDKMQTSVLSLFLVDFSVGPVVSVPSSNWFILVLIDVDVSSSRSFVFRHFIRRFWNLDKNAIRMFNERRRCVLPNFHLDYFRDENENNEQRLNVVVVTRTWESLRPRRWASFFLSGLLMYFCLRNATSRPLRCWSEKTARLNMPRRGLLRRPNGQKRLDGGGGIYRPFGGILPLSNDDVFALLDNELWPLKKLPGWLPVRESENKWTISRINNNDVMEHSDWMCVVSRCFLLFR
jgi:hypothetical protein